MKTQNAFDPTVPSPLPPPAAELPELVERRRAFVADVLAAWAAAVPDLVDLSDLADRPYAERAAASVAALTAGPPVVVGAYLPADPAGHRVGRVDALVRGADDIRRRPQYHPVVVKVHRIADALRPPPAPEAAPEPAPRLLAVTPLHAPAPAGRSIVPGQALRLGRREGDFLQLAHYHRMLQAAGFAGEDALGAVIGTDALPGAPLLAWADLAAANVRTASPSAPSGWRWGSLLDRYDAEHTGRVAIAEVAAAQTGDLDAIAPRLVSPVRVAECARCPWWTHCRPQLDPDDLSLRLEVAPLDRREIVALRELGVVTIRDLAGRDLDALLEAYLPQVIHRAGAETRLRVAARRAGMLRDGIPFARDTAGPIAVPTAEVEVDLDIETSASGRVYLWGFWVTEPEGAPGHYRSFAHFGELDDQGEAGLAVEALGWLQEMVDGQRAGVVYHYSGYEVAMIAALARRTPHPVLAWAAAYAEKHFVDLLEIVKQHFFGVAGLGLKRVAVEAGFRWRDHDPGGLNSQRWFADAVRGEDPEQRRAAKQRVLAYNEDDVLATREVRRWLRQQGGSSR